MEGTGDIEIIWRVAKPFAAGACCPQNHTIPPDIDGIAASLQ
jgi:hypothetical protein